MWNWVGASAALILFTGAAFAQSSEPQNATANARMGGGQTAQVVAMPADGAIALEIGLPGGKKQSFPRLGTEIVPLSGKPGDKALIALDIDGDGVDEIFLRCLVPP